MSMDQAQLTDKTIRTALVQRLQTADPSALVLHELSLSRGERRADVVHVNGVLSGFEIKSHRDSLARLAGQAGIYSDVFEEMTAVVAPCHLKDVRRHIPKNWGILVVQQEAATLAFKPIRQSRKNTKQKKATLIRLLWKNECAKILRSEGLSIDRAAPVIDMWAQLETLSTKRICEQVKLALKARHDRERQQL